MNLGVHTNPRSVARSQLVFPSILVAAACVAYANSFAGVFLFDDIIRIVNEERIRRLWPIGPLLSGERPVVDLSLAINFAMSELRPWSYHAFNLVVHILAGLTLFGIVRRTIELWRGSEVLRSKMEHRQSLGPIENRQSPVDNLIAFVVALLFLVHPLQTQSVTYVIQRGESMMGLFYLLTLYCAIRAAGSPRSGWWSLGSVAFCGLGMGTKAIMVTAPLMVILYDWVFVERGNESSKFKVLKTRLPLYAGLCATWLVLWLVGIAPDVLGKAKYSPVGFSYQGVTPLRYAATEQGVILKYLQLSLWPSELCLDYEWPFAATLREVLLPATVVLGLIAASLWMLWRRHWLGFVGAWFFVILSPTSTIVPNKDPIFEHRMYLPLAAVIAAIVIPLGVWFSRRSAMRRWPHRNVGLAVAALGTVVALPLGYATHVRNRTYHSELIMWQDVAAKRPSNARAYVGMGVEMLEAGRPEEAAEQFLTALRLKYAYADAHFNLGIAWASMGRNADAVQEYMETVRLNPARADALAAAAEVLSRMGDHEGARKSFLAALRIKPNDSQYHYSLGNALMDGGDFEGASMAFQTALSLNPEHIPARVNLGNVYLRQNLLTQAQAEFQRVLAREPGQSTAMVNLGRTFLQQEQWGRAVDVFSRVPQGDPLEAEAYFGAGWAWSQMNQPHRARQDYLKALKIDPNHAGAAAELARLEAPQE